MGGVSWTSEQTASTTSSVQSQCFPNDHHLLITTRKHVYSWTSSGIATVFDLEADASATIDDSRVLTIDDTKIVVFSQNEKDKRRRIHRLYDSKNLQLLSHVADGENLYFSTTSSKSVFQYSIAHGAIVDSVLSHVSPPRCLAMSKNSVYLISSSPDPPMTFLHLTKRKCPPAFHPVREEIFLLGFQDGTVSIHTATRIMLMKVAASDGAIGHLRGIKTPDKRKQQRASPTRRVKAEQASTSEPRRLAITAAAFVGGYEMRIVTASTGGQCRMIDFERGTSLLRAWHVSSPCTSIAVCGPLDISDNTAITFETTRSLGDFPTAHFIAMGREDGTVSLFDSVGLLREERTIEDGAIQDIKWAVTSDVNPIRPSFDELGDEPAAISKLSADMNSIEAINVALGLSLDDSVYGSSPGSNSDSFSDVDSTSFQFHLDTPDPTMSECSARHKPRRLINTLRRNPFVSSRAPTRKAQKSTKAALSSESLPEHSADLTKRREYSFVQTPDETLGKTKTTMTEEDPSGVGNTLEGCVNSIYQRDTDPEQPYLIEVPEPTVGPMSLVNMSPVGLHPRHWDAMNAELPARKSTSRTTTLTESALTQSSTSRLQPFRSAYTNVMRYHDTGNKEDSSQMSTSDIMYNVKNSPKGLAVNKPLPSSPRRASNQSCSCECTDTIREEMSLVRVELASLRKALWVLGSQIDGSSWKLQT